MRVLFFAEAVTLAHVARPAALAAALAPRHHVVIATDQRYLGFAEGSDWETVTLRSIDSAKFLRRLSLGDPVYRLEELQAYVREDLDIIERVRPDLIVGDFRLSLSVSAREAGIQYVTITNAYWSPYYAIRRLPLPVLPFTRLMPLALAGAIFDAFSPLVTPRHCRAINRLREEHAMQPLGNDLRRVYTDADYTFYADLPEMFPTSPLPGNHRFLGPVLWSPRVTLPTWWNEIPDERPIVYVNFGSSGEPGLLPKALAALSTLPVTVIAATAGQRPPQIPSNAYMADYLPGMEAAARASLVVCNGGSPTSQQALAAGVPVLGIASNMDQFLNMSAVERSGAGRLVRADRASIPRIRAATSALLEPSASRHQLARLSEAFNAHSAGNRLLMFVEGQADGQIRSAQRHRS